MTEPAGDVRALADALREIISAIDGPGENWISRERIERWRALASLDAPSNPLGDPTEAPSTVPQAPASVPSDERIDAIAHNCAMDSAYYVDNPRVHWRAFAHAILFVARTEAPAGGDVTP